MQALQTEEVHGPKAGEWTGFDRGSVGRDALHGASETERSHVSPNFVDI